MKNRINPLIAIFVAVWMGMFLVICGLFLAVHIPHMIAGYTPATCVMYCIFLWFLSIPAGMWD